MPRPAIPGTARARRGRRAARLRAVIIALASWLAPTVDAQERPAEPPLDGLSVTAERDDPRRYASASKFTVPHEELTKYGDTTLLGALRRVPGVSVTGTDIRFRGLGSEYTQILINGDPAPQGFTVDTLSPDLVERLEIYRTPVADLSAQSIAGTINIVLRQVTKARHVLAKAGVAYNQGNKSPSLNLEGSQSVGQFSVQLTGSASKSAASVDSHIDEFDYDSTHALVTQRAISKPFDNKEVSYSLAPLVAWKRAGDTVDWQLLAQRFQYPFLTDRNERTLVGLPSEYPYSVSQGRGPHSDLYKSNLSWSHDFAPGRSLESKLNVSYQGRHASNYFEGYDMEGNLALNRNVVSAAIDRTLVSKERYVQPLNASHAFVAGWEGSITQRTESRLQRDRASVAGDVLYELDQRYAARIIKKALYAEDDWSVSGSLDVYLGARFEQIGVRLTGADFGTASNDTTLFSPIAQLIWKMPYNSQDQLRVGIAHTTREPTTAELVPRRYTVNTDNGPANPDNQGNPYLRPERAWGVDASYESYFHDEGSLSLSGYVRHIDAVIIPVLFTDGPEWVTSTANSGTAITYGTALEFKWPLQRLLRLPWRLEFKGDVSANWSRVGNVPGPHNRLAEQTPLSANLSLEYQSTAALSAGASLRYTAGFTAKATPSLAYSYGSTQALDLYALWSINASSRIRLAFDNVFHRNEVFASLYADPSGASSRYTTGDPGAGASLTFEIGF